MIDAFDSGMSVGRHPDGDQVVRAIRGDHERAHRTDERRSDRLEIGDGIGNAVTVERMDRQRLSRRLGDRGA